MCHEILRDARLWPLLLQIDLELAERTCSQRCPFCGSALHRSDFPRKPRGAPDGLPEGYDRRLSFCCSSDGCRLRATSPSVRFACRKVYLHLVVVLVTALRQGPNDPGLSTLKNLLGVDRRTVLRWQVWWKERFPRTTFWADACARFLPPLPREQLPATLLSAFGLPPWALETIQKLLLFLSPTTLLAGLQMQGL